MKNKALSFVAAAALLIGAASASAAITQSKQAVIAVKGLSCPICVHRLEKVLGRLPEAEGAAVNLEKGQAVVTFGANAKITDTQLSQTIRDAGFVPGRIEWRAAPEQDTAQK